MTKIDIYPEIQIEETDESIQNINRFAETIMDNNV